MADLTQTPGGVAIKGQGTRITKVQVGEAVTQGQPGYKKSSDGKYYKADADLSEAAAEAKGIFLTPAAADGYAVLVEDGPMDVGATLTVGETYVVSDTAGGIKPIGDLVTGDYVTHLGVASATDQLEVEIQVSGVAVP